MPDSLSLGPLLLPTQALLLVVATAAALGVLNLLRDAEPSSRAGAETRLFIALAIGVLGARVGWIVQHWQGYAESPWAVLAFRDGGYTPWIGLLVGAGAVAVFVLRQSSRTAAGGEAQAAGATEGAARSLALRRRQLWIPAAVGALVLCAGQLLLSVNARLEPLPTFEVLDMAGAPARLPGAQGRPQVINLWASWCAPCRREMPALARVQAQRADVDFIYLNIGESVDEIAAFTRTLTVPLSPILRDPQGRVPAQLDVRGYPTTLILDAQGRLLHRRSGELSEASLKALLPPAR
ncbi:TlpA disulfide reductase family protein [Aquimonas voraii]|uniref:Thiol-disulfide isomerase or thioredoxin n=1 Tax=Aquimonas voraii TaxID=265719 RepID=A0A1G6S315_9GAMM|nr:TlpA disulfide reductase family protein [Aquimonas voraii]SDD10547.1 Thiol-disulfide isomerase or thioredoxin [Aquimonas voraii]